MKDTLEFIKKIESEIEFTNSVSIYRFNNTLVVRIAIHIPNKEMHNMTWTIDPDLLEPGHSGQLEFHCDQMIKQFNEKIKAALSQ